MRIFTLSIFLFLIAPSSVFAVYGTAASPTPSVSPSPYFFNDVDQDSPIIPMKTAIDECICSCGEAGGAGVGSGDLCTGPYTSAEGCADREYEFPNITTDAACENKETRRCKGYQADSRSRSNGELYDCAIYSVPASD